MREESKGYGLTVYQGTKIEHFDVEVVSILHNFNPKYDVVLIRCTGEKMKLSQPGRRNERFPDLPEGRSGPRADDRRVCLRLAAGEGTAGGPTADPVHAEAARDEIQSASRKE